MASTANASHGQFPNTMYHPTLAVVPPPPARRTPAVGVHHKHEHGAGAAGAAGGPAETAKESKQISLEWTISDLKHVFESSRGETKSKCIKSSLFGEGKWEIYFYANSGADFVSLYLSAEPTPDEREAGMKLALKKSSSQALNGSPTLPSHSKRGSGNSLSNLAAPNAAAWKREGSYRFTFEIRQTGKKDTVIKSMEASDHVFSSEARNWGWQSFARRGDVYYNNPAVKFADSFVISCTIVFAPTPPTPAPLANYTKRIIPADLLDAFAGVFDDSLYSDVKFVIKTRSPRTGRTKERHIYAIKKLLSARADYFSMMFGSGFSEGASGSTNGDQDGGAGHDEDEVESDGSSFASDDDMYHESDEDEGAEEEEEEDPQDTDAAGEHYSEAEEEQYEEQDDHEQEDYTAQTSMNTADETSRSPPRSAALPSEGAPSEAASEEAAERGRPKRTTTMRSISTMYHKPAESAEPQPALKRGAGARTPIQENPPKKQKEMTTVVVKDASYSTYRAVLYFLYTDVIHFAPLSSTYTHARDTNDAKGQAFYYKSKREFFRAANLSAYGKAGLVPGSDAAYLCSAKAVYKLADKLGLGELKQRGFDHIVSSLTVETIPYEAFSAFSNQFGEIRKVQIAMMLDHWNEIRNGQALKNIFKLVRANPDRFPAFEEVWEHLIMNLEYRAPAEISAAPPSSPASASGQAA